MKEGISLFFRNLIFTILQPGLVAGLIPYLILGTGAAEVFQREYKFQQTTGGIIFLSGLIVLLTCIFDFGVKGRGTLSPIDPTKKLVVTGLYKISRNPMYIGVILILAGEAIFFQSAILWIYAIVIFIGFNLFILLHEEPRLKRDFGDEYDRYCGKVRRWI